MVRGANRRRHRIRPLRPSSFVAGTLPRFRGGRTGAAERYSRPRATLDRLAPQLAVANRPLYGRWASGSTAPPWCSLTTTRSLCRPIPTNGWPTGPTSTSGSLTPSKPNSNRSTTRRSPSSSRPPWPGSHCHRPFHRLPGLHRHASRSRAGALGAPTAGRKLIDRGDTRSA